MSPPRPNKTPRILAIVGCIVAILLIYDYFFPRSRPGQEKYITTPSGLKYADVKVGSGPSPKPGQSVTVHYVGTLADGSQFDSSRDRGTPFTFPIGQGHVIQGWEEGVLTMRVGGERKLIVPPDLGYGDHPASGGTIPANATLNFDVELLDVK